MGTTGGGSWAIILYDYEIGNLLLRVGDVVFGRLLFLK